MADDDEIKDPTPAIRASCISACPKQKKLYDACVGRITESKEGDCEVWYIELIQCMDKCVAPKLFAATKGG